MDVDVKSFGGALVWHLSYYFGLLVFVDPYLNTDAGTMSPFEHGEVFVLDDGGEVQLPNACIKYTFFKFAVSVVST
jgi:hypothetical protein